MKRKIIFFDIDGTIVEEKSNKILPSTRQAIKKVRENGHYAVINTGRTDLLIGRDLKEEIGFDGYILGCGTSVKFGGKDLFHQVLPKSLSQKIVERLRLYKIDGVLEGERHSYAEQYDKINSEIFRKFVRNLPIPLKSWDDEYLEFDKMFLFKSENSEFDRFRKEFEGEFDFIDRKQGFYELVPKGLSKATGIEYLVAHLGMSMEDTVAIGDSNNDLSMLSAVHTGIAMGNSSREVLEIADYVTTGVEEDGIENALKWLGVI